MNPKKLFPLLFPLLLLSLAGMPVLFADNNAQPWDAVDAERDAQEEVNSEEKSAQEEMSSSVYGRITNIDRDAKIISLLPTDQVENEDEEEDDEITSAEYHFISNTPLEGLGELSELAVGDYVTLEYYAFRDRNRITEIVFDKHAENRSEADEVKENSPGVLIG